MAVREKAKRVVGQFEATVRDIVLAGVAAAAGYLLAREIPKTSTELKVVLTGALYAGIRAAVAFGAKVVNDLIEK